MPRATAFGDLLDAHRAWLGSVLLRLGVSEAEAPDVTQEVFVVAHSLHGDYDPARPMRPWLFGIAYRLACRWRALARHRRELSLDVPIDAADPGPAADDALEVRENQELVWRALGTIDDARRAVLEMNVLDEQAMPEVAAALGISVNTAYSRVRLGREDFARAIHRLRRVAPARSDRPSPPSTMSRRNGPSSADAVAPAAAGCSFRDGRRGLSGNSGTMTPFPISSGLLSLVSLATVLALCGTALATESIAEKDDGATHLQSLELMLRPTLGAAGGSSLVQTAPGTAGATSNVLDGSASPYGASYGVGGQVGFRFHPVVSAGLRADLATVSASAPADGTTALSRSRQSGGLYVRAYPLALNTSVRKHIDPWIGSGLLYMHDAQSFHLPAPTTSGTTVDSALKLEHHSLGVPLALGVDYRVTRALSIGPSFEYTFLVPIAGCATQRVGSDAIDICSGGASASSKSIIAEATGSWTAGLDIRFTPF